MNRDCFDSEYFKWLMDIVCKQRFAKEISYRKLLSYLYNTDFVYFIPEDKNRAMDGIALRQRFVSTFGFIDQERNLCGPCSVLEMMIALALRCEETIMDDPRVGDRTKQWFWGMITNLGLGGMTDDQFDKRYVDKVITRFLDREYEPNGKGGLFTIPNCRFDLRLIEIWMQLCWYLDSIG